MTVLDPATADFKKSAQEFLDRADAVILHESEAAEAAWREISLKPVARRPMFRISPPPYVTPQIIAFVRERLTEPRRTLRTPSCNEAIFLCVLRVLCGYL